MNKKILIIDDDYDTLQMVGKMLERNNFDIQAANNGSDGINIAISQVPDLILLDVMMPGMDGYEVTKTLRANDITAFIPIILFTAKSQVNDKLEGFQSGADDYLTKPTHPAELIARVNLILNRPLPVTGPNLILDEEDDGDFQKGKIIIGVIGAKGGIGTSTIALNLAISHYQNTNNYVTLAEFRPGMGSIGISLGYPNSEAFGKLLQQPISQLTAKEVENALVTHGSGIQLLLSSFIPAEAELNQNIDNFNEIANSLIHMSPTTVFDLGTGLDLINQKVAVKCKQILVTLDSYPGSIIKAKELIKNLGDLGIKSENIFPVLINRVRGGSTQNKDSIEQKLNIKVHTMITAAPELALTSESMNQAIINNQPESIIARQIVRLGEHLLEANK